MSTLRRGPLGLVRDGAYLLVIGVLGLGLAGGVLAADRAIDAALPTVQVAGPTADMASNTITLRAGQMTVVEMVNTGTEVRAWMADGLPNVELARPNQTSRIRVSIAQPGPYMTELGSPGWYGAAEGP